MKRLLTLVLPLLLAVRPVSAAPKLSCDSGDKQMGPNCVHYEVVTEHDSDFDTDREVPYTMMYRPDFGIVLPKTVGKPLSATPKRVVLSVQMVGSSGGYGEPFDVPFLWNDKEKKYIERLRFRLSSSFVGSRKHEPPYAPCSLPIPSAYCSRASYRSMDQGTI